MRPARLRRTSGPSPLSPTVEKHLVNYVAAAGAAGACLLSAVPGSAEVVYTPANIEISPPYALDLNHDGIPDFTFTEFELFETQGFLRRFFLNLDVPGNAVRPSTRLGGAAAALPLRAKIGPLESFTTVVGSYGDVLMYGTSSFVINGSGRHSSSGPWLKQTNKFLGLRFLIGDQFHYGWARVTTGSGMFLTGYAYETEPGKRILAGQKSGGDSDPVFVSPIELPAQARRTLGVLSQGANGLEVVSQR